jgi:hypothetical protein
MGPARATEHLEARSVPAGHRVVGRTVHWSPPSGTLRRRRSDAVCRLIDRNGLTVFVLGTEAFTRDELMAVLRYRLAQYSPLASPQPPLYRGSTARIPRPVILRTVHVYRRGAMK